MLRWVIEGYWPWPYRAMGLMLTVLRTLAVAFVAIVKDQPTRQGLR